MITQQIESLASIYEKDPSSVPLACSLEQQPLYSCEQVVAPAADPRQRLPG
jgi:hypothetical protein